MKALQLAVSISAHRAYRNQPSKIKATFWLLFEIVAGLCMSIFMKHGLAGIYAYQWIRRIDDVVDGETLTDVSVATFMQQKITALNYAIVGSYYPMDAYDELLFSICKKYSRGHELIEGLRTFLETFQYELRLREKLQHAPLENIELDTLAKRWEDASFSYACVLSNISYRKFTAKAPEFAGLIQKIDWFTDFEDDLRSGLVYISQSDIAQIGVRFEKLKDHVQCGILEQNLKYRMWRREKAQALLSDLRTLKTKLGTNPFDSWVINTIFYRMMIANWEKKLIRLM